MCAFSASFHRVEEIHISNFVTLKMFVKVMMYNTCRSCKNSQLNSLILKIEVKVNDYKMHSHPNRYRLLTGIRVMWSIFALALSVCDILIFQTLDHKHLGLGYVVEKLDLRHSIANINGYKSHI